MDFLSIANFETQLEDFQNCDEKIYNLVNLHAISVKEWQPLLLNRGQISEAVQHRRRKAVKWINLIIDLSQSSPESRDTSIQIFDKFISFSAIEGNQLVENSKFVSIAAAASTLISTKLHDSTRHLKPSSFPYFKPNDLVSFERHVMEKLQYNVLTGKFFILIVSEYFKFELKELFSPVQLPLVGLSSVCSASGHMSMIIH